MANSRPDANGSQFFITYAKNISLDGTYPVFGKYVQTREANERKLAACRISAPNSLSSVYGDLHSGSLYMSYSVAGLRRLLPL